MAFFAFLFGLTPESPLPVPDEERDWIDAHLLRARDALGDAVPVALPTPDFFPPGYDGTPATLPLLLSRVCAQMGVSAHALDVGLFAPPYDRDEEDKAEAACCWIRSREISGGSYEVRKARVNFEKQEDALQRTEPVFLAAAIAHEAAHHLIEKAGLLSPEDASPIEPLADLIALERGMGLFLALAAFRFYQGQNWLSVKAGYLPDEAYGYALAKWCSLHGYGDEHITPYLNTNVRAFFLRSAEVLRNEGA